MTDQQWLTAVLTALDSNLVYELRVLADAPVENAPEVPFLPRSEAEIADLGAWEASTRSGSAQL